MKLQRRRFELERLERRTLLSVTSAVSEGGLTVESDGNDEITIRCSAGKVRVNGMDPDTGPALCAEITSIDVTGGPRRNRIDLHSVTPASFPNIGGGDSPAVGGVGGDIDIFIDGGAGNDRIVGSAFADDIDGGDGADDISGREGNDEIAGGEGRDVIDGTSGNDQISGGAGNDVLRGGSGADQIAGDAGNDQISGGADDDDINGGEGNDVMNGNGGNDILDGCDSTGDVLIGGAGSDMLLVSATDLVLGFGAGDTVEECGEGPPPEA
jgi:Ca2+-binding RTX toxin-like protein